MKIGVDVGGVLSKISKNDKFIEINMEGCLEALKLLKENGHQLYLISFCGKKRAKETKDVLNKFDLFEKLFFVKKKDYKSHLCKALQLDMMIDDTIGILWGVQGISTTTLCVWFQGDPFFESTKGDESIAIRMKKNNLTTVKTWTDVLECVEQQKDKKSAPKSQPALETVDDTFVYNV